MGWKTSCLLASQHEEPIRVESLVHDPAMADRVAEALPGEYVPVGESTFETGGYPSDGHLHVGAYERALVIGALDLSGACLAEEPPTSLLRVIDELLPGAWVLALQLQSVVNWYGYAYFVDGQLVRGRAGCADDGVTFDVGDPLSEEEPLFARAIVNEEGEQVWSEVFDGQVVEMDHSSMGEEFVFEAARRFFGQRLDEIDDLEMKMSEYRPARRPPARWLLGP